MEEFVSPQYAQRNNLGKSHCTEILYENNEEIDVF